MQFSLMDMYVLRSLFLKKISVWMTTKATISVKCGACLGKWFFFKKKKKTELNSYYQGLLVIFFDLVQHKKNTFKALHKIPTFYLISWCRHFVDTLRNFTFYINIRFSQNFYTTKSENVQPLRNALYDKILTPPPPL